MRTFFMTLFLSVVVAVASYKLGMRHFAAKVAVSQTLMAQMDRDAAVFDKIKAAAAVAVPWLLRRGAAP